MKNPNIKAKGEEIEKLKEDYVNTHVRPYLQQLLDKAQGRMKRNRLKWRDGMGLPYFEVDGQRENTLDAAIKAKVEQGKDSRLANAYPELVEFLTIAWDVWEHLTYEIDDMEPSHDTCRWLSDCN